MARLGEPAFLENDNDYAVGDASGRTPQKVHFDAVSM